MIKGFEIKKATEGLIRLGDIRFRKEHLRSYQFYFVVSHWFLVIEFEDGTEERMKLSKNEKDLFENFLDEIFVGTGIGFGKHE